MDLIEAAGSAAHHRRHPWEHARLWVLHRLIARGVRLDRGAQVIDIGCGDAFVIGELARAFPDIQFIGVDAAFTPEIVSAQRRHVPSNVTLYRALDEVPASHASLILLMDVIEHIEDDASFLATLRRRPFIGSETRFIVTVPAYQSLFSSHDVFLKHFRRYTNRQLRDRLEGAGLQVVDIGYFFASLLPLRTLELAVERLSPPRPRTGTDLTGYSGGRVASSLLSGLLKTDAFVGLMLRRIGITVPGLSNYAICRTAG